MSEPVMPVSRYCKAFRLWRQAIAEALERGDFDYQGPRGHERFQEVRDALDALDLAVTKSNLLWRLIYGDETQLRTEKCPVHQGHWSGCYFDTPPECGCGVAGNITGWLPLDGEQPDPAKRAGPIPVVVRAGQIQPDRGSS